METFKAYRTSRTTRSCEPLRRRRSTSSTRARSSCAPSTRRQLQGRAVATGTGGGSSASTRCRRHRLARAPSRPRAIARSKRRRGDRARLRHRRRRTTAATRVLRVPADWVVPRPEGMTCSTRWRSAPPGYTAGARDRLMEHNGLAPENGPVVVTGATGGVGSVAIEILAKLGYHVVAITGKAEEARYLQRHRREGE